MHQVISKTANGQVFKCSKCHKIHIEYKNLNFNLSEEEYKNFVNYINSISGKEWEHCNRNSAYKRKILLPVGSRYFYALFNNKELEEFKYLLQTKRKSPSNKRVIILRKVAIKPESN